MEKIKSLKRLIANIQRGKFHPRRYLKKKPYFGLMVKVDSIYANGGFGMSIWHDEKYLTWLWWNYKDLNLGGRPYEEVLLTI